MFKITCSLDMLSDMTDSEIEGIFEQPSYWDWLIIETRKTRTIHGWVYEFDLRENDAGVPSAVFAAQMNSLIWEYIAIGAQAILNDRPAVEPDEEQAIKNMLSRHNDHSRKMAGR